MLNAATCSALVGEEDSHETISHLTRTFRLVNQKLSGREAIADTTFAAVVAVTQFYRLSKRCDQGLVHLAGL